MVTQSDHSLLAQANGTQAPPPRTPTNSKQPRRLTDDDFRRLMADVYRTKERAGDEWNSSYNSQLTLDAIVARDILPKNDFDPADADRLLEIARMEQEKRDSRERQFRLRKFNETIGARFANATIDNYAATLPEQVKVISSIKGYAGNAKERMGAGDGIVLFGNAGTGKTHLLVAVCKEAILAGFTVGWNNGQDFFARCRDAIDLHIPEKDIVDELTEPDVLVLDDLLPPGGTLTPYQAGILYRVIDTRYRNCKSTMVTMNVAGGTEAEQGMGVQIVDRLRDGALTLFCNWPSHRKAKS